MTGFMRKDKKMKDDFWGEPISIYTRKQAIEDGVLIDVSEVAKEFGFRYPTAITQGVWAEWIVPPESAIGQDENGRLWDLLNVFRWKIKNGAKGDRVAFKVFIV
jgi:hypothetical protein